MAGGASLRMGAVHTRVLRLRARILRMEVGHSIFKG